MTLGPKSADPRSGVLETVLGGLPLPYPPSALGVATGQHQNPRRVSLKRGKPVGGSRLKVKNPATGSWVQTWFKSADPRRFRPGLGGRFTYPPTPLPPLDPPIFDESFKRHPTRLLRSLNGTPRQFWNVVSKSTAPEGHVPMRPPH